MNNKSCVKVWLSQYKNRKSITKEFKDIQKYFPGVVLCRDIFTFNDGTTRYLACLKGTIPVHSNGLYNLPICIWLMGTHPLDAPVCYVIPSSEIRINTSSVVDGDGKIYLPYLSEWTTKSKILELLEVMTVTLSGEINIINYSTDTFLTPTTSTLYPDNFGFGSSYGQHQQSSPIMEPDPIPKERIKNSLLTALEEKILRRMTEMHHQRVAELECLRRTNIELKEDREKLDRMLENIGKEEINLNNNIILLREKEMKLDVLIDKAVDQEVVIDDLVDTNVPLYYQLLNACAEEAAYEDAMYYLNEAFQRNAVDLDTYLKEIRALSRKQFYIKAIIIKCRDTAGLFTDC